jgi:hypothetical protein
VIIGLKSRNLLDVKIGEKMVIETKKKYSEPVSSSISIQPLHTHNATLNG